MSVYINMNVILGLCHSYSGKVVTFQESFIACKRKLSKTSRLLRLAATGNCPDRVKLGRGRRGKLANGAR